jgi:hypothetical protein
MRGHLTMSQKERQRHLVFDRVVKSELRLSDAVRLMEISYRHGHRLLQGYRESGEASLVHGLRGRAGTHRRDPAVKAGIVERYRLNYKDFGPTLASEKLAERDGLSVNPETLRLWLIESKDWTPRKRRSKHRSRRERRACFGELVQVDGSHHAWFEERGAMCCLITLVDDATGRTYLLFAANEGTFAVMAGLRGWVETYGIPQALYTDRLKTYLTDRQPTVEEQLDGQEPATQFGRACNQLGIHIIAARAPQAKGRVENKHGLTQDRLVKELRLAGISTIEGANKFLATWLPGINERFSVLPADLTDMHRPVPDNLDLSAIFCRQQTRRVGNDWVVRHNKRYLQILKQPDLPPSGSVVTIREWAGGNLEIWYKERRLQHVALSGHPERPKPVKPAAQPKEQKPAAEHPWRQSGKPPGQINPRRELVEQVADHYLGAPRLPSLATGCMRNVTFGGEL